MLQPVCLLVCFPSLVRLPLCTCGQPSRAGGGEGAGSKKDAHRWVCVTLFTSPPVDDEENAEICQHDNHGERRHDPDSVGNVLLLTGVASRASVSAMNSAMACTRGMSRCHAAPRMSSLTSVFCSRGKAEGERGPARPDAADTYVYCK